MAKEYLMVDGKVVLVDGELVQVPDEENLNDLADENGALATQSDEVANEIEDLIVKNGVIDGSPRDVYENLSALQTAYPNGASGVYLTRDNGHWYYWNGSAWTDGGVYQANGITDGSITNTKIANESVTPEKTNFLEVNNSNLLIPIASKTNAGVNCNYDFETGYYSCIGTCTSSARYTLAFIKPKETGTYSLSCKKVSNEKPSIYVTDLSDNIIATYIASNFNSMSFNLEAGNTYCVQAYFGANISYNMTVGLKVELGSNATNFSKTLFKLKDFIDTLEDNSVTPNKTSFLTKLDNKNILKFIDKIEHGVTFSISNDDGYYSMVGTKDNLSRIVIATLKPKTTGTYVLSWENKKSSSKPALYICQGETVVATFGTAVNTISTTLEANTEYTLEMWASNVYVNYDIGIQLEYGISATDFENPLKEEYAFDENIKLPTEMETNNLKGKYLSICGVSIDTYDGYIPSGNSTYYRQSNLPSVNMTWWKKLLDKTEMNLLVNNSWSGARATTTNGVPSSGVHRCVNLDDDIHTPDFIIIGAFALNDWLYADIGNYTTGTALPNYDVDLTNSDNYETYKNVIETYKGAMATMFYRIQNKYPNAKLYVMDSYNYYRNGSTLTYSGSKAIYKCNEALYEIANMFGVEVIKLSQCGLTYVNTGTYCVEGTSSSTPIHPNDAGHTMIYREALEHFNKYNEVT